MKSFWIWLGVSLTLYVNGAGDTSGRQSALSWRLAEVALCPPRTMQAEKLIEILQTDYTCRPALKALCNLPDKSNETANALYTIAWQHPDDFVLGITTIENWRKYFQPEAIRQLARRLIQAQPDDLAGLSLPQKNSYWQLWETYLQLEPTSEQFDEWLELCERLSKNERLNGDEQLLSTELLVYGLGAKIASEKRRYWGFVRSLRAECQDKFNDKLAQIDMDIILYSPNKSSFYAVLFPLISLSYHQEVNQYLEKVIALNKLDFFPPGLLVRLWANLAPQAAVDFGSKIIERFPDDDFLITATALAQYRKLGDAAGAVGTIRKYLKHSPSPSLYVLAAKIYLAQNDYSSVDKLIEQCPTEEGKRAIKICLASKKKDFAQVFQLLESWRATLNDQSSIEEKVGYFDALLAAFVNFSAKAPVELFWQEYEHAIQAGMMENPMVCNDFGYAMFVMDSALGEAEQLVARALKHTPWEFEQLDSMACISLRKGKLIKAKDYMLRCLALGGTDSGVILEHAGDIFLANGDLDLALGYYKQALLTEANPLDCEFSPERVSDKIKKLEGKKNSLSPE